MAPSLYSDFKEFLKLLNEYRVEYLLIGGYAVGLHGYVRSTQDMDIWVSASSDNAERLSLALQEFGFPALDVPSSLLAHPDRIFRMGVPPTRIEITTSISGVSFPECRQNRVEMELDGLVVPVISLPCLRRNKKASGRHKDLADLENLPEVE